MTKFNKKTRNSLCDRIHDYEPYGVWIDDNAKKYKYYNRKYRPLNNHNEWSSKELQVTNSMYFYNDGTKPWEIQKL